MSKWIFFWIGICLAMWVLPAQEVEERTLVTLETTEGEIVLALFNETPLHRDHFVRKVKEGVYDGRTFNRVIEGFVVQCGEEEEADVIPAEIRYPQLYHRRGVLAMGRCTDDPTHELKSASEQFYIAWGKPLDEKGLQRADSLMQVRSYGRCSMDEAVKVYYRQHPGLPALDGSYTIFGEVVKGLEIVEHIQSVQTDQHDRPLQAITIRRATVREPDPAVYWSRPAVYADAYRLAEGVTPRIECRHDSLYTLRDWYGVEKYDLEFRLRPDGGIELLDYYWTTEEGECFVQCRREDIGYAAIPQRADQPNGGLEGNAQSGRLHFRMTAHQNDDQPIEDPAHPEFIFEW